MRHLPWASGASRKWVIISPSPRNGVPKTSSWIRKPRPRRKPSSPEAPRPGFRELHEHHAHFGSSSLSEGVRRAHGRGLALRSSLRPLSPTAAQVARRDARLRPLILATTQTVVTAGSRLQCTRHSRLSAHGLPHSPSPVAGVPAPSAKDPRLWNWKLPRNTCAIRDGV